MFCWWTGHFIHFDTLEASVSKYVRDPMEYNQHTARQSVSLLCSSVVRVVPPEIATPLLFREVSSGRIKETCHRRRRRRLSILIEPNFQSRIPIKSRDIDTQIPISSPLIHFNWLTVYNQSHVTGTITVTLGRQPLTQNQGKDSNSSPYGT